MNLLLTDKVDSSFDLASLGDLVNLSSLVVLRSEQEISIDGSLSLGSSKKVRMVGELSKSKKHG